MGEFECRNRRPSREVVQTLRRIGGHSLYGPERFRIVWGWDVRDYAGENMFFRYDTPERWLERFHLEYWVSPGTYGSPETWEYNGFDKTVGPFPHRGGYERFLTFENAKTHEFIEPTPELVEQAVGLFWRSKKSEDEIKMTIDADRDAKAEGVRRRRNDIIDDNVAAFGLSPWMPVSGPLTPTSRRTDWRNKL